MANENNLVQYSNRSREEVEEIQSKGGKKSGEARRRKRDMRKKMQMILSLTPQNCEDFNSVSEMGIDMADIDNEMVMLAGLFKEAKSGNVSAVKEIRNILGEDNSSAELDIKQREFDMKKQAVKDIENNNGQIDKLIEGLKNG